MKTLQSFFLLHNKDSFGKIIIPKAVFFKLTISYQKKISEIMADAKQQMKAVIHQTKKQIADHWKIKS